MWDEVVGTAKSLRWRLATQPQPLAYNTSVRQMADAVITECARLDAAVDVQSRGTFAELGASARSVLDADAVLGTELLQAILELDVSKVVVVGASGPAVAGIASWLNQYEVRVQSAHQLHREGVLYEQAFAVGPPRFLPRSLATAPLSEGLSYYLPTWFGDRSLPSSALTGIAECPVRLTTRIYAAGDLAAPAPAPDSALAEEDLTPTTVWIPPDATSSRSPGSGEVEARRVLLSGGFAILLDDGEWIRGIVPSLPGGDRVTNVEISAVRPGTYLLLREGATEQQTLYDAAIRLMGPQAAAAKLSQERWKTALQARLDALGTAEVRKQLKARSVKTLRQIKSWTSPTLIRPHSNNDFALLLDWLGIPHNPAYPLAAELRKSRGQASSRIADQLERAVEAADMGALERDGHLRFKAEGNGFRSWIATRVLLISPRVEVVTHNEARTLMPDRRARWLE